MVYSVRNSGSSVQGASLWRDALRLAHRRLRLHRLHLPRPPAFWAPRAAVPNRRAAWRAAGPPLSEIGAGRGARFRQRRARAAHWITAAESLLSRRADRALRAAAGTRSVDLEATRESSAHSMRSKGATPKRTHVVGPARLLFRGSLLRRWTLPTPYGRSRWYCRWNSRPRRPPGINRSR